MNMNYDVVIVGTGAAGLYCALNVPAQKKICMITKKKIEESDSFLAQGGICMLRGEEDFQNFYDDTFKAGHFENDPTAVEIMIRNSNGVIRDLIEMGVDFTRNGAGELDFTKEGAHSQPRILYHEDITGNEISSRLLERVRERENIEIYENTTMVDIIEEPDGIGGIVVVDDERNLSTIRSPYVVLACGGIGGIYNNTTNFPHITGDAVAIAKKHGIELQNLDYVQIHPTTLFSNKPGRRFLISESVRGEGAILLDAHGERFVDELLPRDVVSKAIWAQMEKDGANYVWEDMRPIGKDEILEHFPNIYAHCLEEGYNVLEEPIPVVPAQHYFMGGIKVDKASRTSLRGLYAVGETSCNGVHGKNRLASNSLLEALVFSKRAADDIFFGNNRGSALQDEVDLGEYEDLDAIFASYKQVVRDEIERMRLLHE